jgi:disulfide bond formation protein DsbB
MLETVMNAVHTVFLTGDRTTQIIMLLIALIAGLRLGGWRNLVNVTLGALVLAGLVRLGLMAAQGTPAATLPETAWNILGDTRVSTLLIYFIAFAIVIFVVHVIRSAMARH